MEMLTGLVILPASWSFLWEELGKKYSPFKEKKLPHGFILILLIKFRAKGVYFCHINVFM